MVSLGLIGRKLGHSFSADYFTKKFREEGVDGEYRLYPIPTIDELPGLLDSHPDLDGLNVTIPYKEAVIPLLDHISEEASAIGAVNIIDIRHDGDGKRVLYGYNSDWKGFSDSILPLIDDNMRKAIVLGTGGASKAVGYVLKRLGIEVLFVSRNPNRKESDTIAYENLTPEIIRDHRIIVNTTPLGMFPANATYPDIQYDALTELHLCYDLVYNPEETEFMKRTSKYGAKVKNGLEMLHRQADISREIWNDHFKSDRQHKRFQGIHFE